MQTRLTEMLGITHPILNAPMTPQAGGVLARAVSEAGAFGIVGLNEDERAEQIAEQVALITADGFKKPFGIGLVIWVLERRPDLLDLAIAAKPTLVSISFGDPAPYVERLHRAGILVASQVQSRDSAQQAARAGVDVVVAQGTEAGGHTGAVGTLPLLQIVLDAVDVPVVAAGGIASGRGLAAVLAAGAVGAWIGTPFLAAAESRTPEQARDRIVASDETQTVLTSVFDRAQGKPWPSQFRGRALRNRFTEQWHGREEELLQAAGALDEFRRAKAERDYGIANVYAGQSVGMVSTRTTAREIVERIAAGAEAQLRRAASLVR
ncbi:nitronate monooxygenase [bacterium]|nr:MAG: nitronate monooxygenase [bacterium]